MLLEYSLFFISCGVLEVMPLGGDAKQRAGVCTMSLCSADCCLKVGSH